MAGGFRSLFGVWIGGLASGPPTPVLCPCPEYGQTETLAKTFTHETNQLACSFSIDSTLNKNWKRKGCD